MSILQIGTDIDLRNQSLDDVGQIHFTNGQGTSVTAHFTTDVMVQLGGEDGLYILREVVGSDGINRLVVHSTVYGFGAPVMVNWSAEDELILIDTNRADYGHSSISNCTLYCRDGDDTLYAGGHDVTVFGGLGDDEIQFNPISSGIVAYGGDGDDSVTLWGGGSFYGGDGADFLWLSNPSDQVISFDLSDGGGGRDIGNGFALGGLESLFFTGSSQGDSMSGAIGDDGLAGNNGRDLLSGWKGDDGLYGGHGADRLLGGSGRDYLLGSFGADVMNGGLGHDVFAYRSRKDFGAEGSGDLITDFVPGVDRFDLRYAMLPSPHSRTWPEPDGFTFLGTEAFGADGGPQARFYWRGENTILSLLVMAEEPVLLEVELTGHLTLTRQDFIL